MHVRNLHILIILSLAAPALGHDGHGRESVIEDGCDDAFTRYARLARAAWQSARRSLDCDSLLDRVDVPGELAALSVTSAGVKLLSGTHDRLELTSWDQTLGWGTPLLVASGAEYSSPQLVAGEDGSHWAAWLETGAETARVLVQRLDDPESMPLRVFEEAGPQRDLTALAHGDRIWLTWVSDDAGGRADVHLTCIESNGAVATAINVSQTPSNDWRPTLAITSDGRVHLAWDSFLADNYDVLYRVYDPATATLGPLLAIATGPEFQAHAHMIADEQDRLWIVWEEAQADWGRGQLGIVSDPEWGPEFAELNILHARRSPKLRILSPLEGTLLRPNVDFDQHIVAAFAQAGDSNYPMHDEPRLFRHNGRTWIVFRSGVDNDFLQRFNTFATAADDTGWYSVERVCTSGGYLHQPSSISAVSGHVWIAGGVIGDAISGGVFAGRFLKTQFLRAEPLFYASESLPETPAHAPRAFAGRTIVVDGVPHTTAWGDLHRHTELSWDKWWYEGTAEELYRYARDVAGLQFVAHTDHHDNVDNVFNYLERHWPRVQITADLHDTTGFAALYGYEWSATDGEDVGHHNVISATRMAYNGWPEPHDDELAALQTLFAALPRGQALAIPHTPAASQNTRTLWAKLATSGAIDPDFHRVVEIYQAARQTYEYRDAPNPFQPANTSSFQDSGAIRKMLESDARLGFIASSDHRANFRSFAVAYAVEPTRESILEALRARRCYASTSRDLLLDFRVNDRPMGEEIVTGRPVRIVLVVEAPSKIARVDVMRDAFEFRTYFPTGSDFSDELVLQGGCGHAYYLRVQLVDGNMGWSSPIWVDCPPIDPDVPPAEEARPAAR